jgi:hypothetical protein
MAQAIIAGRAMAQAIIAEACVSSWAVPCGICGMQTDNGAHFSLGTSVLPCRYHSTIAPYSNLSVYH